MGARDLTGPDIGGFQAAGRTLLSLGMIRDSEGNLSTFDGTTVVLTRTGARLADLAVEDLVGGRLDADLVGATSDLEVHRAMYRDRGPGAIVHAHPPGSVPEDGEEPGRHGSYAFAATLLGAVDETVRRARSGARGGSGGAGPTGADEAVIRAVEWRDGVEGANGVLAILDQRRLPGREAYLEARTPAQVAAAIRTLAVRGAPLLGIAAAYGAALAAQRSVAGTARGVVTDVARAGRLLVASRPTAVNVGWAVRRASAAAERAAPDGPVAVRRAVLREAHLVAREEELACRSIGRRGAELIPEGGNVLTHCNTGVLATGGMGTAQGIIVAAHRLGRRPHVWVDETRPLLQGARLTAWELHRLGIPMTLVADTAAGALMAGGEVDVVVVGADRIAANGDVANKIGTYQLAVLALHHRIPFYVAAPFSTVDLATPTGGEIVVESRDPAEITHPLGRPAAPPDVLALNPAFDVTPARLISAIVTDRGVARAPYRDALRRLARGGIEVRP